MNAKVLFVDDEPNVLEGIRQNLRKAKFQVITTSSIDSAFEILANNEVDVVVSDERMPIMSGHQFLTVVYEKYPKTVRLMLSGQAKLEDVALAVNNGKIYKYLAKPTPPQKLITFIDEAISIRQTLLNGINNLQSATVAVKSMNDLEASYPGITKVQRDEDGCIIVDEEG